MFFLFRTLLLKYFQDPKSQKSERAVKNIKQEIK